MIMKGAGLFFLPSSRSLNEDEIKGSNTTMNVFKTLLRHRYIIRYVCNIYTILNKFNRAAVRYQHSRNTFTSTLRSLFHRCFYNVTARHRLFYNRNNLARPIRIAIRSNAMVEEQIRVG